MGKSLRNGPELWRLLVALTENCGSSTIRSLRTPLFVLLQNPARPSWRRQLGALLNTRMLHFTGAGKAPPVVRGRVWFCLSHSTASNVQNLLPVIREVHKRGLFGGVVATQACLPLLREFEGQAPIVAIDDLLAQLSFGDRFKMARQARHVYQELREILKQGPEDLVVRLRANAGMVTAAIMESLQSALVFQRMYPDWDPSCVVSTSDMWPLEHQFALQASLRGASSLVILHGAPGAHYWPFVADRWLVWGPQSFEEMVALGAPPERLEMCGMPASDELFRKTDRLLPVVVAPDRRQTCLILSHTRSRHREPEIFSNYRTFLTELVSNTPSVRWLVKSHPAEDRTFWDSFDPETLARLEFLPKPTSLGDSFREADAATTLYSTAGLQAMIAGLPLLIPIVSPRMLDPQAITPLPGALQAHTPEAFARELERLRTDAEYRTRQLAIQYVALDRAFDHQGRAGEATAQWIEQFLLRTGVGQNDLSSLTHLCL